MLFIGSLEMFWKLFRSEEAVTRELRLHRAVHLQDLSPSAVIPANDSQALDAHKKGSRLWIEDWKPEDAERAERHASGEDVWL